MLPLIRMGGEVAVHEDATKYSGSRSPLHLNANTRVHRSEREKRRRDRERESKSEQDRQTDRTRASERASERESLLRRAPPKTLYTVELLVVVLDVEAVNVFRRLLCSMYL